jgi:hypothetical protein
MANTESTASGRPSSGGRDAPDTASVPASEEIEMPTSVDPVVDAVPVEDLLALSEHDGSPLVTMTLPTHRVPTEVAADRLLLDNVVREAREVLTAGGMRSPDVERLLEPVVAQWTRPDALARTADGLAIFVGAGVSQAYRVAYPLRPLVVVGEAFHVGPLAPAVVGDESFWLLALSRNQLRLWWAGDGVMDEWDLAGAGVPTSQDAALAYEEHGEQLQSRATAAGRQGGAPVYHGHGGMADDHHPGFERYVRVVSPGLEAVLAADSAPLVVAAVGDDAARFSSVSPLGRRVAGVVPGSPDRVDRRQLHRAARLLIVERARRRVADVRHRAVEDRRIATDPPAVVTAATEGRVASLLVERGAEVWTGTAEPASGRSVERRLDEVDLVGVAVAATLRHGGEVLIAGPDELDGPMVAHLRFAASGSAEAG